MLVILPVNWLAHILLADPDGEDQLGGVLADLVSMTAVSQLPAGIQRGVALHLAIDSFSDAHPAVGASVRRVSSGGVGLRPAAAAIAVDVLYDHLLTRAWAAYGPPGVALEAFTRGFYDLAAAQRALFPPTVQLAMDAMAVQDWLGSYQTLDGVRVALERIRRRLSPRAAALCPLANAVEVFRREPEGFQEDFARFWPEVAAHARGVRAAAKTPVSDHL